MTKPFGDLATLRDHVLSAMAERSWTQADLARAMGLNEPRQVNKVCNAVHVGKATYAKLELALLWPVGRVQQILEGLPLTDDDAPTVELALARLKTAKESLQAAERILRLLQPR